MTRKKPPSVEQALAALTPEELARTVVDALKDRPDSLLLSQALIVRLANLHPPHVNYGGEAVDNVARPTADTDRKAYHMSAYPQITGGALSVVIAQDAQGEAHVLLGKKRADALPSEDAWRLPGGFMSPKPAHSQQGIYPVGDAMIQVPAVYDTAANNKGPVAFDASLEETAARKLQERTGLSIPKEQFQLVDSFTDTLPRREPDGSVVPKFPDGQTYPPYQQQVNGYLAQLPPSASLPEVTPKAEFAEVVWAKLSDMQPSTRSDGKQAYTYQGREVLNDYVPVIEKAVTHMRNQEITAKGVAPETVKRRMQGKKPDAVLGAEAEGYYQATLQASAALGQLVNNAPKGTKRGR